MHSTPDCRATMVSEANVRTVLLTTKLAVNHIKPITARASIITVFTDVFEPTVLESVTGLSLEYGNVPHQC